MRVSIQNLTKKFGDTVVLQNISLEVNDCELFFLLGPSGCGKTTLLRLIAGFYHADAGRIFFGEKPMDGVPAHRRNTGMVFQNYALWPHMTVAGNVAYGLEVRGVSAAEKTRRVGEALAIVRMEEYAARLPNQIGTSAAYFVLSSAQVGNTAFAIFLVASFVLFWPVIMAETTLQPPRTMFAWSFDGIAPSAKRRRCRWPIASPSCGRGSSNRSATRAQFIARRRTVSSRTSSVK